MDYDYNVMPGQVELFPNMKQNSSKYKRKSLNDQIYYLPSSVLKNFTDLTRYVMKSLFINNLSKHPVVIKL